MSLPTLVVVSGPGGSGKTTLAHAIARGVGCPAICRDELKEGMAHAHPGYQPAPSDELTRRTYEAFSAVVSVLIRAGVTTVAEAAFQDKLWRRWLEPLLDHATVRVVQCRVDPEVAHQRMVDRFAEDRLRAAAHGDPTVGGDRTAALAAAASWQPLSLDVPTLWVDTSDGYTPDLAEVVAFADG